MDRRFVLFGGSLGLAFAVTGGAGAQATLPAPRFERLPNGLGLGDNVWDAGAYGYQAEEYLMIGEAPKRPATPANQGPANFGIKAILGTAPYVTRIVVYTPRDPRRFSGNVVIEPFHPRNYPEVFSVVSRFLCRRGDAIIHVSQPSHFALLQKKIPGRYERLATPDPTTFWGYLGQLATMVKARAPGSPVPGAVRRIYLTGYSATAGTTYDFYNYHHNETRLANGAPVFDGYLPHGRLVLLAPERDAVLVSVGTQSDYLARYGGSTPQERAFRAQFDSDAPRARRRRYEVPGLFHAPHEWPEPGMPIPPFDPDDIFAVCSVTKELPPEGERPNDTHERPVFEASFHHASRWVEQGIAPPRAPLIDTDDDKTILDQYGNAQGGLRLPEISVPTARYVRPPTNQTCGATGYRLTFPKARLVEMYGDRRRYLAAYDAAADRLAREGFVLPEGAAEMKRLRRWTAPVF